MRVQLLRLLGSRLAPNGAPPALRCRASRIGWSGGPGSTNASIPAEASPPPFRSCLQTTPSLHWRAGAHMEPRVWPLLIRPFPWEKHFLLGCSLNGMRGRGAQASRCTHVVLCLASLEKAISTGEASAARVPCSMGSPKSAGEDRQAGEVMAGHHNCQEKAEVADIDLEMPIC